MDGDIEITPEVTNEPKEDLFDTLDEPVYLTIWRDVKKIGIKLFHVIIPRGGSSQKSLRDWDLWGPLVFCLTLALTLSETSKDQSAIIFSAVFVIVWLGSVVSTINILLLGGKVSFFQSLCVFGYCIFPLCVASLATLFWGNILFRLALSAAAVVWSSLATVGFISPFVPKSRRLIALYPVLLFYLILGWMVLMHPPLFDVLL